MSIAVEALFATALGLQAPRVVSNVDLNTVKRRIDFEVKFDTNELPCPACGVDGQGVHDCWDTRTFCWTNKNANQ